MTANRRLPVYLLLDTSGSMSGEPIEQVKTGLRGLISSLRGDPHALETIYLSIITFGREVREVCPLTEFYSLGEIEITCPASGPTNLGAGLETLIRLVDRDVARPTSVSKGDWRPLVFIVTDGNPSDTQVFEQVLPKLKAVRLGYTSVCGIRPKAGHGLIQQLADGNYLQLDAYDLSILHRAINRTWASDLPEWDSVSV